MTDRQATLGITLIVFVFLKGSISYDAITPGEILTRAGVIFLLSIVFILCLAYLFLINYFGNEVGESKEDPNGQ